MYERIVFINTAPIFLPVVTAVYMRDSSERESSAFASLLLKVQPSQIQAEAIIAAIKLSD